MIRETSSPTETSSTSSRPTMRATSRFRGSRISATMWYGSARRPRSFVIASIALITSASGSLSSGARMTIEREVPRLASARSPWSIGSPVRQTIRVRPVDPTLSRISSSITTLSFGARTTMHARGRLAFAWTSSEMTVKICCDQPRITVWPASMTRERPLRSSSSFPSMPLLMTPIRALMTKMPPKVTASIPARKSSGPWSPPMVPESRVRRSAIQSRSPRPYSPPVARATTIETMTMTAADASARPPMSAIVPRAMKLSKA